MNAGFVATVLLTVTVAPAAALERTEVRADRNPADPWDAGASCTVTYANRCTGWLWLWRDFHEDEVVGVVFDPCCSNGTVAATQMYFWTGSPLGYGFTGTLSLSPVVAGCPGAPYHSRPLLPPFFGGPVVDAWSGIPPGPVALTYTYGRIVDPNHPPKQPPPAAVPTDHPAAGPTGPQACGLCYPSTRTIHTFRFGSADSPLCPGSPLNDGVCDAEALFWSAQFSCAVAVEPTTWGSLKSLYR